MLSRYQKSGGFLQLLNLIETCGGAKQEKLLKVVEEEDSRWAEAIRGKILTIKRILSWGDTTLLEIVDRLKPLTLGTALHGFDEEIRNRILKMVSHGSRIKLEEVFSSKVPTPAEIASVSLQIVTEVRELVASGTIDLEKVDPEMVISENFEEKLLAPPGAQEVGVELDFGAFSDDHSKSEKSSGDGVTDLGPYLRRIKLLQTENSTLKEKVTQLESKLSQIRKIV